MATADFPIFDLQPFRAGRGLRTERHWAQRSMPSAARPASWRSAGHSVPQQMIDGRLECRTRVLRPAAGRKGEGAGALSRLSLRLSRTGCRGARQVEGRRHAARSEGELQRRPALRAARTDDPEALAFCYAETIWPPARRLRDAWKAYYARDGGSGRAHHACICRGARNCRRIIFDRVIDRPVSALRALNYPAPDACRRSPANCAPAPTPTMAA